MAHIRSARRIGRRRLVVETLDARLVLATVSGVVFEDVDLSAARTVNEAGLANRLVYADLNGNARVDLGEPISKSDADGHYALQDLPAGELSIRLFNGSASQRQTSPWTLLREAETIPATDASLLTELDGGGIFFVNAAGEAVRVASDGTMTSMPLQGTATHAAALPGGRVLVVFEPGTSAEGAAVVDFASQSVEPPDMAAAGGAPVRDAAVAAGGRGLLIVGDDTSRTLVALDASGNDVVTRAVGQSIAPAARLIAGGSDADRVGIVQPTDNGVQFLTWNTLTESVNLDLSGELPGAVSVDAFAGAGALLVTSHQDGSRAVRDANASFLSIGDLSHTSGPAAFDATRNVVFGLSAASNELVSFDILSGASHAYPNALPDNGAAVRQLVFLGAEQRVVLATAVGIERLLASAPAGHRVTLASGNAIGEINFGIKRLGQNTSPTGGTTSSFEVVEDGVLTIPASGLLGSAADADGDTFIALADAMPAHGSLTVGPDGGAVYVPAPDYAGSDQLRIVLHDGASSSDPFTVTVDILPQNDPPSGFLHQFSPIGEHAAAGTVLGQISVDDPDQGDLYVVTTSDPRFEVVDGSVVRTDRGMLNFESEPSTPVLFTGVNTNDSQEKFEQSIAVEVTDQNDPITGIDVPDVILVPENTKPGVPIVQITVLDEDANDSHVVEVGDTRFQIVDGFLELQPGTQFDFEDALPDIPLNFIARETHAQQEEGEGFIKQALVRITDANDPPKGVALTTASVLENSPGEVIAPIAIEDQDVDDTHTFTIDDDRFEVVDGKLKLKDGVAVSREDALPEELVTITITITVTDSGNPPMSTSSVVELIVAPNSHPYHNKNLPGDVNGDGIITPEDAIIIINELNSSGPGVLMGNYPLGEELPDVNGDGFITPIDVLIIINQLNQRSVGPTGGQPVGSPSGGNSIAGDPTAGLPTGEGEAAASAVPPQSSPLRLSSRQSDEALSQVVESLPSDSLRPSYEATFLLVERQRTPAEFDSALDLLKEESDEKVDEKSLDDLLLG